MKKLVTAGIVASTLLLTNASADTKWYAGVELGSASNTTEYETEILGFSVSDDVDNNYKDIKFVVGKGTGDNWYTQLYLSKVTFDNSACYYTNSIIADFCFDDEMMEIGVEVMKKFEVSNNLLPFVKFGFGVGSRDAEGLDESSISSVGLAIGAGLDFKVNESISLLGGIDFGYRKYQDVEYFGGLLTVETSETYQKLYIGANYRF